MVYYYHEYYWEVFYARIKIILKNDKIKSEKKKRKNLRLTGPGTGVILLSPSDLIILITIFCCSILQQLFLSFFLSTLLFDCLHYLFHLFSPPRPDSTTSLIHSTKIYAPVLLALPSFPSLHLFTPSYGLFFHIFSIILLLQFSSSSASFSLSFFWAFVFFCCSLSTAEGENVSVSLLPVFVLALSFAPFEISQSIRGTQFLKCSCFLPIVFLYSSPTSLLLPFSPLFYYYHGHRSLVNAPWSNNVNVKNSTPSTSFSSTVSQQLDYYRAQVGSCSVKHFV